MALVRCEECGIPKGRIANSYRGPGRLPVGYPRSGLICGSTDCANAGLVWLLDWEHELYRKGVRVFSLTGRVNHTKLAVQ
jgi:hypothetical protein